MNDPRIASIRSRRVWDSRGRPTVEVEVELRSHARGRAIAPSGASTGSGEALERRDGGPSFGGFDVRGALGAVEREIAPLLLNRDCTDQDGIDRAMIACDGTPDKARIGANAIVATSMAVAHAAAAAHAVPLWRYLANGRPVRLPLPEIQIFGGGAHAARRVDVQDFMVLCPGASRLAEALDWTAEVYRAAGALMKARGLSQGVADEGGHWPAFRTNEEALETLVHAIEHAGFTPRSEVAISLDVAASQLRESGRYVLALAGRRLDTGPMIDLVSSWLDAYPIVSVEDPLAEDDLEGFATFARRNGGRCQIIGDDLLVTDASRVRAAAAAGSCNAVLIKPNQAGTLTEAREALAAGVAAGFGTVVSARSGESEDVTVAHLAVGWDAGQIKVGSFSRSERMAKWNELLRIEEALGGEAVLAKFPHA